MKKDLIIVLYGSTGDLSFRKLLPSFSQLILDNEITQNTLIIAVGRRDFDTKAYFDFVYEHNKNIDLRPIEENVQYHQMQISDSNDYSDLNDIIIENSNKKTRVIHYLSVAPELMLTVAKNISENSIVKKGDQNSSLVFEKPFGSSYDTAHEINLKLWEYFDEKQIYRMDHYLGKPLVTELLNFRFKNNITKNLMNSKDISSIEIVAKENDGVLNRGPFYDKVGATKDMFQSHLLQLVTLVAMDEPSSFKHEKIINEKVKVLNKLMYRPKTLVFGQYKGYLNENSISEKSLTETLFKVELKVKNKFRKIPIKIYTGKKLNIKETYIKYNFKDSSFLKFNMSPNYTIELESNALNQVIESNYTFKRLDNEYSRLIHAAINFEKEKFVRWDEIELSWKFTDTILKHKNEIVIYHEELI